MKIPNHIEAYWCKFLKSDLCSNNANKLFQASYQIGADEDDANEGIKLILKGEKTATSSLLWELEENGETIPKVGDLCVIENGKGIPVCVVQTTWVNTIGFGEVDSKFALDYGETDGSLEDWKKVFGEYYSKVCVNINRKLTSDTPLVCERFRLIYS